MSFRDVGTARPSPAASGRGLTLQPAQATAPTPPRSAARRSGGPELPPSPHVKDLPAELLVHIAACLPETDLIRFANVDRELRAILHDEAQCARLLVRARRAKRLCDVHEVLAPLASESRSRLSHRPLTALAAQIPSIRSRDRFRAVACISEASRSLPPAAQAEVVRRLAWNVLTVPPMQRLQAVASLIDTIGEMAQPSQAATLEVLVARIQWLPTPHLGTAFKNVLQAVERLPPEDRQGSLTALSSILDRLPARQQMRWFDTLMEAVQAIPVAARAAVYPTLALQIAPLHAHERVRAFERLVRATGPLPRSGRTDVLMVLIYQVEALPAEARADALRELSELDRRHA